MRSMISQALVGSFQIVPVKPGNSQFSQIGAYELSSANQGMKMLINESI